jgi:hypothetical protein
MDVFTSSDQEEPVIDLPLDTGADAGPEAGASVANWR